MKLARPWYLVPSALAVLSALFFAGCMQPTKVPIETIRYDAPNAQGRRLLFVFLPGNGDPVSVFQKEGLIEAVRERGLPVDMIAVNAHIGYYMNGSFFTRIKDDVIGPATAIGYEQVWMIGNSLGGFGSLSYAREYPEDITGIVLLGPFLGEPALVKEIGQAGGLQKWEPGEVIKNSKGGQEKLNWIWLRDRAGKLPTGEPAGALKQAALPKIYLGYGDGDRFSPGQKLLGTLLPSDRVHAIDGGHDWTTWKKLWILFLDQNVFLSAASRGPLPSK
jgi:pimeloyl-ACP methyl ester carboxylesterase